MKKTWLICDFHIHTDISDGKIPINEVIKLYGEHHFDVISITDHIVDSKCLEKREKNNEPLYSLQKENFQDYLRLLWKKSVEAWEKYNMLIIPGAEITNNTNEYHILAIDIKEYIEPDLSVKEIIQEIHKQGGIAIACHPHYKSNDGPQPFLHLWNNHDKYANLFDAWEVANRNELFNVIGLQKFNYIANSDFHEAKHLYSWKTFIGAVKNREAIKTAIHKNDSVAIFLYRKNNKIKI